MCDVQPINYAPCQTQSCPSSVAQSSYLNPPSEPVFYDYETGRRASDPTLVPVLPDAAEQPPDQPESQLKEKSDDEDEYSTEDSSEEESDSEDEDDDEEGDGLFACIRRKKEKGVNKTKFMDKLKKYMGTKDKDKGTTDQAGMETEGGVEDGKVNDPSSSTTKGSHKKSAVRMWWWSGKKKDKKSKVKACVCTEDCANCKRLEEEEKQKNKITQNVNEERPCQCT